MANRTLDDREFRAIKHFLERYMIDSPRGGKKLQSVWTDARAAREISKTLNLKVPLTANNVRHVRTSLYGVAYKRKTKDQGAPTNTDRPANTFADLERRISALEARVYMPTHQVEMDLPKPVTSKSEIDELFADWTD